MAPFCVPGLTFRKAASCFKLLKTRDLPLLANKMHNDNEGRIDMNNQLSVETAVCSEHQRLLAECEQALDNWNDHRTEFCKSYPIGKEAGDELVRLQAKYARAYTVLRKTESCQQDEAQPLKPFCTATFAVSAISTCSTSKFHRG